MKRTGNKATSLLASLGLIVSGIFALGVGPVPIIQSAQAQPSECYDTFSPRAAPGITMEMCKYSGDRKSGYFILRNNTGRSMDVCWTIKYQNAPDGGACHNNLRNGQEVRPSCYNCNPNSGGPALDVVWRKVEPSR